MDIVEPPHLNRTPQAFRGGTPIRTGFQHLSGNDVVAKKETFPLVCVFYSAMDRRKMARKVRSSVTSANVSELFRTFPNFSRNIENFLFSGIVEYKQCRGEEFICDDEMMRRWKKMEEGAWRRWRCQEKRKEGMEGEEEERMPVDIRPDADVASTS